MAYRRYITARDSYGRPLEGVVHETIRTSDHPWESAPLERQLENLSDIVGRLLDHMVGAGHASVADVEDILGIRGLALADDES